MLTRALSTAVALAVVLASSLALIAARPAPAGAAAADPARGLAGSTLAALRVAQEASREASAADVPIGAAFDAWATYVALRGELAGLVAPRADVSAEELDAAWNSATPERMTAVLSALGQLGVPYRRNRSEPGRGFDCSGLTTYAWGEAGVSLPRNSRAQIGASTSVDADAALPGDLVYYPGHVMLYLGTGRAIVHAPSSGKTVEVKPWARASALASPTG